MAKSYRRKERPVDMAPADDPEEEGQLEEQKQDLDASETETMDIYDDEERIAMLEADEISSAESGFMEGAERALLNKKQRLWDEKDDTEIVTQAKLDAAEQD